MKDMMQKYTLDDDNNVVPCTLMEWATMFEGKRRIVSQMMLPDGRLVSTVFLGIDHNWDPDGPPHLFETMVFEAGTSRDQYCERCSTWSEALAMHDKAMEWAIAHPDGEDD